MKSKLASRFSSLWLKFLWSIIIDQRAQSAYAYAVHANIKGERFKALNR
jgi:hypothetical protein